MQAIDQQVLEHIVHWLAGGGRPWLCTIVKTLGSSPRPVGSILAVNDDGRQVGSVSGGCVEEDMLEKLSAGAFAGDTPALVEYGLSAEENERLGLPCGGRLTLMLQQLHPGDAGWLAEALEAIRQRRCIERHVDLESGATRLVPAEHFTPLVLEERTLRQCFGPRMRMLLVGAGQLAQTLAELGLAMDYEVQVTDPRKSVLEQWEGPVVPLLEGMPDDVIREQAGDRHSIVITLTHDPRIDDMALMEALCTEAWYVGALGSTRTTAKRIERLRQLDLTPAQIARLHAPVGLDIGSKTPIEIAVAIMAELTRLRRRPPG